MARKFLYVVAILIALFIGARIALGFFPQQLTRLTLEPTSRFEPQPVLASNAYADPALWLSRPGITGEDPARWTPEGFVPDGPPIDAAVFFIHPTTYLKRDHWNAPLDDADALKFARVVTRANASVFGRAGEVWVPRYRQATIGAFVSDKPEARQALDLAYADVARAFDLFIAAQPAGRPIVIAGHSQGSYLAKRLTEDKIAGTPLAARLVAVYAIGWVVDPAQDLPRMKLPACAAADQAGCVISYLTFADQADVAMMRDAYRRLAGGAAAQATQILCSNPLTGGLGGSALAAANIGAIVPDVTMQSAKVTPGLVGAACAADGTLRIGEGPDMGPFVLPGGNYHIYDYALYWTNLRQDFARRVAAWQARR
ncbi:DUF3089 domain-containing protein [Novosphingobium sp.]|uniref:DUF3089 domain-containing protein n=1 Tax=Novosphingobium sp. TaxID=1874826 RepID=UPI00286A7C56|nr:DUF3089 domain-containing protein [Novosphingobium sp.]